MFLVWGISPLKNTGEELTRPLLSLERLSFDFSKGKVIYRHGENTSEEERMDYLEFITREGLEIRAYKLSEGKCKFCGYEIAG